MGLNRGWAVWGHRKILIGHPVAFGLTNSENYCWYAWEKLLPQIKALNSRLFLAPTNLQPGLGSVHNYRNTNKGYVDLTFDKFGLPLWFTEIGLDRTKADLQHRNRAAPRLHRLQQTKSVKTDRMLYVSYIR